MLKVRTEWRTLFTYKGHGSELEQTEVKQRWPLQGTWEMPQNILFNNFEICCSLFALGTGQTPIHTTEHLLIILSLLSVFQSFRSLIPCLMEALWSSNWSWTAPRCAWSTNPGWSWTRASWWFQRTWVCRIASLWTAFSVFWRVSRAVTLECSRSQIWMASPSLMSTWQWKVEIEQNRKAFVAYNEMWSL